MAHLSGADLKGCAQLLSRLIDSDVKGGSKWLKYKYIYLFDASKYLWFDVRRSCGRFFVVSMGGKKELIKVLITVLN